MEYVAVQQRLPPPGRSAQGGADEPEFPPERITVRESAERLHEAPVFAYLASALPVALNRNTTNSKRTLDATMFATSAMLLAVNAFGTGIAMCSLSGMFGSNCIGVRDGVDIQRNQKRRRGNVLSHRIGQYVVVLLQDRKLSNFGDSVGCASGNPGTLDARAAEIHPAGMLRDARRAGVGRRCARGRFYRPTVVGQVEAVRRQVI
jgi:hypothetical protein